MRQETHKNFPRWGVLLLVIALGSPAAFGAIGDVIDQFVVPLSAVPNFCSIGLAFDGTSLFYNRCGDPEIHLVNPNTHLLISSFDPGTMFALRMTRPMSACASIRRRNFLESPWFGDIKRMGLRISGRIRARNRFAKRCARFTERSRYGPARITC